MAGHEEINQFVMDCSVTMTWLFQDQATEVSGYIKHLLINSVAYVPGIWPLEVANVLYLAERKKKISEADSMEFKTILNALPISIDDSTSQRALESILNLARQQQITVYDASYLEMAMRKGLPLATLDNELKQAAKKVGVKILTKYSN
jgi:predicted nucleic acid-binding protein